MGSTVSSYYYQSCSSCSEYIDNQSRKQRFYEIDPELKESLDSYRFPVFQVDESSEDLCYCLNSDVEYTAEMFYELFGIEYNVKRSSQASSC
jgi:hypothetical protein